MPDTGKPQLWIVAGPNGSGKSTLYANSNIRGADRVVWIINLDALAERIRLYERKGLLKANGEALDRIMRWLRTSIRAHQTVGFETVLSTAKYRPLVKLAKEFGFDLRFLYVFLNSIELNVERVRLRVRKGGHAVDTGKIRERAQRSFE